MIDFRYHIVSIIAVFLALALGLFLGSTTLQGTVTDNLSAQASRVTHQNRVDENKLDAMTRSLGNQKGFLAALEPYAVSGRLAGDRIALVSAPGVDDSQQQAIGATLQQAGATVTASVSLAASYLDPTKDSEMGELARELNPPGHHLPRDGGAEQVGAVIASVLTTKPAARHVSAGRVASALQTLVAAKLLTTHGDVSKHAADMAVLIVSTPASGETVDAAHVEDDVTLGLARGLHNASSGVVVVGPRAGGTADAGPLQAVAQDSSLSDELTIVAGGTQVGGRIATVFALESLQTGVVGSFGLGAGSPLPTPSPTPSPTTSTVP